MFKDCQMTTEIVEKKITWNCKVWKELGKEYFDLSHFHGFKELSISEYLLEKIFWLTVIIGAFGVTGYLIYLSIQDFNDDKKQTFVQKDRYGNISLPILYCPSKWIDLENVAKQNMTTEHLAYVLSHLRTNHQTYFDESSFHNYDFIDVSPKVFCNESANEPVELSELVYMAPFIGRCLVSSPFPDYFEERSLELRKKYKLTGVVATNNVMLMKTIFEKCLQGKTDDVWKIFYERFYLSVEAYPLLETMLNDSEQIDKVKSCGYDNFSVFITLKEIDQFNVSEHVCSKQNYSDLVTNISVCSLYNHLAMYYMFNGDVRRWYDDCLDCDNELELERQRSRKFAKLLVENNHEYAQFLARSNSKNSFKSFKKFLNNEIGGSDYHQNKKFVEMRTVVYKQFKENEKRDFDGFLKNNSIFDLLKKIAFDKSKFLLSMSVDPAFEIRPRSGSITVEMVTNTYGICYLFQINADMTPLTCLPSVMNEVDKWRRINQKLYVNIVELDVGNPLNVRGDDNIIVFGSSAYGLVPSKNWFKTDYVDNWEDHYNQFQISNLAYQNRAGFEECGEKLKNGVNVTYTYDNCLTNCFSKYTQPKYIGGDIGKPSYCEYITENFMGDKTKSPCNFFSGENDISSMQLDMSNLTENLQKCQQECRVDCETIDFDVKTKITTCNHDSDNCVKLFRSAIAVYENPLRSMEQFYVNLPKNQNSEEPIWLKRYDKPDDPCTVDMINGIKRTFAKPISRLEIQITSDVTTYVTSQSLVWYSYLGVVGGQINLIVSGSVITLFQLIWWISRYCYKSIYTYQDIQKSSPDPVRCTRLRLETSFNVP